MTGICALTVFRGLYVQRRQLVFVSSRYIHALKNAAVSFGSVPLARSVPAGSQLEARNQASRKLRASAAPPTAASRRLLFSFHPAVLHPAGCLPRNAAV